MSDGLRVVRVSLSLLFLSFFFGNVAWAADRIELVSRGLPELVTGTAGGVSSLPTGAANQRSLVSADGRWSVFVSTAPNLASGQVDTNSTTDVFLYDRENDAVTLVSHADGALDTAANGASLAPSISADGRWIAFGSESTNLSPGQTDTNAARDVFLYDRDTGAITLVSRTGASATTAGDNISTDALISADGSAVVYVSRARNLMAGQSDLNNADDVFYWSRATGINILVSHITTMVNGSQFNSASNEPVISADGEWVAFSSTGTNLVPGVTDSNLSADVFLWNRTTNTHQLVSHSSASALTAGTGGASRPRLSADGSTVLFHGTGSNYVPGFVDGNVGFDYYLFSRDTGAITLVSHAATSPTTSGNRTVQEAALSADGNWVAFASDATNHVAGQVDPQSSTTDVFLFSRADSSILLVSRRAGTTTTVASSSGASPWSLQLSDDGAFVVFRSSSNDLVAGQSGSNGGHDLFVFDRLADTVSLVSSAMASASITGNGTVQAVGMSGDGRWILFAGASTNHVSGIDDLNESDDVFLTDQVDRTTTLVSRRDADLLPLSANGDSAVLDVVPSLVTTPAVSGDGRYTVFQSMGRNLVPGQADGNGGLDVFLHDLSTGAVVLVSRANGSTATAGNGASRAPVISTDGRWVAFVSRATNLIAGQSDSSGTDDVFLWDRTTGNMSLVSRSRLGAAIAVGSSTSPLLTATGTHVVFLSTVSAGTFINFGGDQLNTVDAFSWDRSTGAITVVSRSSGSSTSGSGGVTQALLSSDGRYVGLVSTSSGMLTGQNDNPNTPDLYQWDRTTGAVVLVSHAATSNSTAVGATSPAMSADGNYMVFSTRSAAAVSGIADTNNVADLYLWSRTFNFNTLVSRAAGVTATTANGASEGAAISADGSFVVYLSRATNLMSGVTDSNAGADAFLYPRTLPIHRLVSHTPASTQIAGNGAAQMVAISSDGTRVAFVSTSTNLVSGQTDAAGTQDLFIYALNNSQVTLASHRTTSATTGLVLGCEGGALSTTGKVAVFQSTDPSLVSGDFNGRQDVFLWTDEAGTDLAIAKTNGVASVIPGQTVTWQITATNTGPLPASATVADSFMTSVLQGITWTCAAGGGATCSASGAGTISDTVSLPVNGTVTYTVTATVSPDATGTLVNTATITPGGGITDTNPANNSATDTDTLTPQADLLIAMSDTPDPVGRGALLTWLVSVTNAGPSTAASVTVTDTLPAGVSFAGASGDGWTCGHAGGVVTCTRPSLAPGSAPALSIQATAPVARGIAALTNTVLVAAATADPVANNAASTETSVPQPGITVAPVSGLTTTEAGGTASFTVVLDTAPLADVTIPLASSDTAEGTVSPSSLTFTTGDWATPQTVTVTGVDDDYDDGDVAFTVTTGAAASSDIGYAGIDPADVAATNQDDDAAGFAVSPTAGLITTEAGGTATFTVALTSRPRADVTIALASSDTAEGTVDPASLTFTTDDWNTPKTATVTGVNDDYDDGNAAFTITTGAAASADTGYAGIDPADVAVSNEDDDTAGFAVTPTSGLTTTEAGGTATFTVALLARPRSDVTIALASDDSDEGTVDPASLTFTTDDWSTPKTVTVTGVDDDYDDGTVDYTITTGAAGSADAAWAGLDPADVSASNEDDDSAGIVVAPTGGLFTTEGGGTATFTVVLAARPTGNVTIALESSDAGEGLPEPASLTFTPGDWATPQTVIVTGQDDDLRDGDTAYTILLQPAESGDPAFAGIDPADVSVVNRDDGYEGVFYTVSPCILVDTRQPGYGPALQNNQVAIVDVHGACGIPPTARAVVMNLTFSGAGQSGSVAVYPGDLAQPPVNEYLWIRAGNFARSLFTTMPLGADGTLAILPKLKAPKLNPTVHIILDVSGYFE